MPSEQTIARGYLEEITWDDNGDPQPVDAGKNVPVQFNPASLKVTYSVQTSGGDQRGGSAAQFNGLGTTKLALELLFDVTVPLADGSMQSEGDVRKISADVVYFITPKPENDNTPPGVRFIWGSFKFEGIVDSVNETLDYFSNEGKPLRTSISLGITRQEVSVQFEPTNNGGGVGAPGTQPQEAARDGETVQDAAARKGKTDKWKSIAEANGIENPRQLGAGTLLDMNARVGGELQGSVTAGLPAGVAANLGASGLTGLGAGAPSGKLNAGVAGQLGLGASSRSGGSLSGGFGAPAAGAAGLSAPGSTPSTAGSIITSTRNR